MQVDREPSLEDALARTEKDAESALKASAAVTKALKRFQAAARVGNLRDLEPAIANAEQALAALRQQLANTKDGWEFDEAAYFEDGAYTRELLATAEREQVRLYPQDDRLYCYPTLVRVLGRERAVLIDRARERRLRPSVLIARLKELQEQKPRFRTEEFLESLFGAYAVLVARNGKGSEGSGTVERLLDVYGILTLAPGAAREYSRQEFARDLYLLDQSGQTTSRRGYRLSLPAAAGTRSQSQVIKVITQSGGEKLYYGIAFDKGD